MCKNKQNKQKKQAAFTFVEVLVATMLSAFVMTAFGSMMALSMRVAEASEMEQLAQLKAQQVMEFFRRERLVRGWNTFFTNLDSQTYCLNDFPDSINQMSTKAGSCGPTSFKQDLNFFYYKVEAVTSKTTSPPAPAGEESVLVVVNIYRYNVGGTQIGSESFFTVEQTFKRY